MWSESSDHFLYFVFLPPKLLLLAWQRKLISHTHSFSCGMIHMWWLKKYNICLHLITVWYTKLPNIFLLHFFPLSPCRSYSPGVAVLIINSNECADSEYRQIHVDYNHCWSGTFKMVAIKLLNILDTISNCTTLHTSEIAILIIEWYLK